MKVEESNRLIAEFMEAKLAADGNYVFPINFDRSALGDIANLYNMKFKYSWDWLMPVILKINEVAVKLDVEEKLKPIHLGTTDVSIMYTYNEVVEFIQWYNENN